jgi:membrane protease YdiL (CAAX protease family)
MNERSKYTRLYEAILCSFALMVFSFFIHFELPLRLLSFAALLVPAWYFSRELHSFSYLRSMISASGSFRITTLYVIAGILSGIFLGISYRWHLDISVLPKSFHYFVLVAALIGGTEELVFRGFLQDYVKSINVPFSVLFSSVSHTAYKCCLFLSPVVYARVNIGFLAIWTLAGGLLLGTMKHLSKSILPPLIAHVIFDILVYAEFINAPWWVW